MLGFLNILQSAGQTLAPTASWKDPITLATIVIAASGLISLLVTVMMLRAMRAQTTITQGAAARLERRPSKQGIPFSSRATISQSSTAVLALIDLAMDCGSENLAVRSFSAWKLIAPHHCGLDRFHDSHPLRLKYPIRI